jgi:hypothetical protein
MPHSEHLNVLFDEIGPLLDASGIVQAGDDTWLVVLDDARQTEVVLDLDQAQGKLTLSMDVAQVQSERRLQTYETLLMVNYLWAETGGVRFALDGPGGQLVQLFDLFVEALDAPRLMDVIVNFAASGNQWQDRLAGGGLVAEGPSESDGNNGANIPLDQFIRV